MCASCGCGCKSGMPAKGCKCTCKTCREARTMSVEKFHLVNKANRGFEAIADALLDEVYEDDLVVDEDGNVYALVGEIEKADEPKASAGRYAAGYLFPGWHGAVAGKKGKKARAAGNELGGSLLGTAAGGGAGYGAYRALASGKIRDPRAAIAVSGLGGVLGYGLPAAGAVLGVKRAQRKGYYKPQDVEKGLPSVARQAMRSGKEPAFRSPSMQFRMNANKAGQDAARNISATGGSPFASAKIQAGRDGKLMYRNYSGQNNAVDSGKLGGEQGKRRLAELTTARRTRQAALASRRQQIAQQTGRGVLP